MQKMKRLGLGTLRNAGKRSAFLRNLCLIIGMFVVFAAIAFRFDSVKAAETEKSEEEMMEGIKAHRGSIVRIESICWDGEAKVYCTKSFSGFVVSSDTTGIYVVTANHHLIYTSEEKEAVKTEYELENNARISEKIEVVFNGDLRVQADIVGESEQRNLTVLKLDQSVHFEHVLQFAEKNASNKEQIFLLSYPQSLNQGKGVFSADNVMITSGNVLNSYLSNEIIFLKHDIETDEGSVGGALLNQEGLVVGLLLTSRAEKDGTAVSCEALKSFLDTFNVSYQVYEKAVIEEKLPVLNIFLSVIIAGLFLIVVMQKIRGRSAQNDETEKSSSDAMRKKGKKKAKRSQGNPREMGENVHASLEYPAEKRLVIIRKAAFLIGRIQEADFVISESKGISRKHAYIRFDGKNFYLMDMQSTNHTFLNGTELLPGEKKGLKDGDEIMVGKERLIFHRK